MRLAVAVVAGALYGLAHVGWGFWPLGFVCFALWWWALEHDPVAAPSRSGRPLLAAAKSGLLFGAVAHSVAMPWLLPAALRFASDDLLGAVVGGLAVAAHTVWVAGGFALVGITVRLAIRFRMAPLFAGPAALVLMEALQPQIFHAGVGALLVHAPGLSQLAEFGGVLGLTLGLGALNGGVLLAFQRARTGRHASAAVTALAVATIAIAAHAFGLHRAASVDGTAGTPLRVGVVQSNVPVDADRLDGAPAHEAHLEASRALLAAGPVDLLVWPEGAYPRALPSTLPIAGDLVRRDLATPLLFGANAVTSADGRRRARNSVFLVESSGRIGQRYDKRRLIPFAESVPLGLGESQLAGWLPRARRFQAGEEASVLAVGPHRIATPVCFEITDPDLVRRFVSESGATLIVTVADDGWFGRSREPEMHLAIARLRAIELRRWIARAANAGPSALIDPTGRLVAWTSTGSRAELAGTLRSRETRTLYARAGEAPALLLSIAWLGLGVGVAVSGRR